MSREEATACKRLFSLACVLTRALFAADTTTVEVEVTGGGDPYVVIPPGKPGSSGDEPALLKRAFASAERAITESFGSSPIYMREGGSIPIIGDLKEVAGLDSLLIGLFTPADNLHAPDESFHLGIMDKATDAFEDIFEDLAQSS